MTKLSLAPLNKGLFLPSHIIDHNVFTEQEVDWITNYCAQLQLDRAGLFVSNENYATRTANTAFIEQVDSNNQWLYQRIHATVERHNNENFNFDLYGIPYLQYAEYETGGHHHFHMDTALGFPPVFNYRMIEHLRKLTVVILLNNPNIDFGGGEFLLNTSTESTPVYTELWKGSVIIFPSLFLHKVCPVNWGLRKTLTSWVLGPKFR